MPKPGEEYPFPEGFDTGAIVPTPPEHQRRVEPVPADVNEAHPDYRIARLRKALENLAGDVYLWNVSAINREQLMRTQGEALVVLAEQDGP